MKKLFLILCVSALLASCISDQKKSTLLTLKLENATIEVAEATLLNDFINFDRETISAVADEDGNYTFELPVENPQMVFITLDRRRLSVYLDKGAHLTLSANMEDWDATLNFSGDLANENNFLQKNTREVEPQFSQNQTFSLYRSATAAEFVAYADEKYNTSFNLLQEFEKENKIKNSFKDFFLTDISYTKYSSLIYYSPYFTHFNGTAPELTDDFYAFLDDAKSFSDDHFRVRSFCGFLNDYTNHLKTSLADEIPADLNDFEKGVWIAHNSFTGKARDYVITNMINSELNWGDFSRGEKAYNEFIASTNHADLKSILQATYESALKVAPGNEAPAFTLTSIDGDEISLSDFKGKVVYLDFWASWCGPCMREVPHAKELKKRFDGVDDLVFLYVSVDEDQEAWRRTVEQHQIQGVHLNIKGMNNETARQYNIKGVPSFFIIDREGVIKDNNPGRPSSGETIDQQLRAALGA
jgi:thiol-disulfide isomerase/thioredoxin